jgi:hypothetical protein
MNQLRAVALNEGLRRKEKLFREAGRKQPEAFRLAPWASRRRRDLLELLDRLTPTIAELTQAMEQEMEKCPAAIANPSRGRPTDGPGLRADYREGESLSMWQADRQLSGAGAIGEIEWGSAPAGTYHETREHTAAFPAGGGSASDGAEPRGMAE